jgi:hypothetical protein
MANNFDLDAKKSFSLEGYAMIARHQSRWMRESLASTVCPVIANLCLANSQEWRAEA